MDSADQNYLVCPMDFVGQNFLAYQMNFADPLDLPLLGHLLDFQGSPMMAPLKPLPPVPLRYNLVPAHNNLNLPFLSKPEHHLHIHIYIALRDSPCENSVSPFWLPQEAMDLPLSHPPAD